MGEFAKRHSDGQSVKIGTCEDMYYLRLEDRDKVTPEPNSGFGYRFRLPFPNEDHFQPGEYDNAFRALRLYKSTPTSNEDFTDDTKVSEPGRMQIHHEPSGLYLVVNCYHGTKLPDVGTDARAGWNGKGYSFELSQLRVVNEADGEKVYPVVKCRHCGEQWRYQWSEVWDYIEKSMQEKLESYRGALTITV
jgi:hypothetical protein